MSEPKRLPGVPEELLFNLPMSMLDSRKIEQRIQPYSQAEYKSAGQVAKFTIPQTSRTLLGGQTMYLTGRLTLENLEDGKKYAIYGSYYSMFSRQVVSANGSVLETIEKPGELVNQLINMTMNSAEKIGQSNSLGCAAYSDQDSTSNVSLVLGNAGPLPVRSATTQNISFAIPIIGVLDAQKYIPMWNSNIELELTINELKNWLADITGATAFNSITFTLSDLELVFDSIELSPESFNMVMLEHPQKVVIKTQSYLFGSGSGNITKNNFGAVDIPINARLTSMKQLFFYFTREGLADRTFGGVNPNANDVVFITNGQYYPQRPIKCTNPSECYMQIQKAFGSIKSYSHSGCIGKAEFIRRDTQDTNKMYLAPITQKTQLIEAAGGGNKFYLAIDTEIINTNKNTLYNGIPTGVNSNIRVNIADPLSEAYICYYWACYDILLEMDFTTGITRSIY